MESCTFPVQLMVASKFGMGFRENVSTLVLPLMMELRLDL